MVGVGAVQAFQVQGHPGVEGEGAEELLREAGVVVPHALLPEIRRKHEERAAADVHRGEGEGLVHRRKKAAEARNPRPVAERLRERAAQHDARVLDRMVPVHVQVARRLHGEAEAAVHGKRGQHVVEKADARLYPHVAAVKAQPHGNIRFLRLSPLDRRSHFSGSFPAGRLTSMELAWAVSPSARASATMSASARPRASFV